ncbi:MAG: hypothetical protein K6A94_00850 [Bacteroidales bacterium]|nr:hypothetical protein [Bacteroidales bacterium]
MKRYRINIKLSNGDEVKSTVEARNQADAIKRLEQTPEFARFVGPNEVVSMEVEPIPIEPIDNERFAVTTIDNKPDWYVVADLDNMLKIEWKKGMYNETQRVLPIGKGKPLDAQQAATAMREIADYLIANFKELI